MGALSLARRAGHLAAGFDTALDAARHHASLVLLASDVSPGTEKRVRAACQGGCPVRTLPRTQNQLAQITRKPVGVLAVTSPDFAMLISRTADEEELN